MSTKESPKAGRSIRRIAMTASVVLTAMLVFAPQAARASFGDAPEIDPGSMAGAMTLLVGGLLALTDRARRA